MRDVLLQPFRSHKYESLKSILIERRSLTTPERVNKVISGEKMGSDIPSRFLGRLQKTAGFGTQAVVGKAVIRQTFIRQMPTSIRAHLATQPDSATLESLAMLADRTLASETDVEESKPGVAEIKIDETAKLVGLLEDLSKRLKKLETATAAEKKRNSLDVDVLMIIMFLDPHPFQTLRPQSLFLTNKVILKLTSKIFVHTHRRRTHSKIMLRYG